MGASSKELARKLRKLAKRQHGCFTAARPSKPDMPTACTSHVKNGKWSVFSVVFIVLRMPFPCVAALLWTGTNHKSKAWLLKAGASVPEP